MKFLHTSDLHLGKSVHEFSMLEDQEYILKVILNIADEEKPQALLISGDVFDRTVAPTEALRLFDNFLDGLVRRHIEVFVISGNHDSADRLAFGSRLMDKSGVHISRVYDGQVKPFVLSDELGEVNVYLLPFLKPVQVRKFFPDIEIDSWTDAVRTVIERLNIDESKRNILLAHQFVTDAVTCDSEEINIGGADNVDAEVYKQFDYVALGHLHGAQSICRETLRYCGTPLKYSFSEKDHKKSITVAELFKKGFVSLREIPLVPKRDMREIRGKYLEITSRDFYRKLKTDDYYRIILTDEEDQPDALGKLRIIYPNLMQLDYDNKRTRVESAVSSINNVNQYTPIQLFDMLYEEQNGQPISRIQRSFLDGMIEQVWEAAR
ncbi:MAG: exonuclease SbcCD subunit D [Clostridiales bacterium]|jgi:exonuclease SbcD|nr:exonuclease SbcCD subunit D [Clostridiales bacterium]